MDPSKIPSTTSFFTSSELARALNVPPQRLAQLVQEGKLPPPDMQAGNRLAYSPDIAAQVVASQRGRKKGERWITFAPEPNPAHPAAGSSWGPVTESSNTSHRP